MRIKLASPESEAVAKTDWKLRSIHLDAEREVLQVVVAEGYLDGLGQFIPVSNQEITISGAEFQTAMQTPQLENFTRRMLTMLLLKKGRLGDIVT